ncbi:MAG: GNAT family N-acetyltransferase, partial [Actinomycetota bacterium]|nr:GNAT family N-acetyltransferase [Actinomycetota bacterium]
RVRRYAEEGTNPTRADELIIRDAAWDEVDEISKLIHLANEEFVPSPMRPERQESWDAYWKEIGNVASHLERAEVIVAEKAGRVVGTVTFYPDPTLADPGGVPRSWPGIRLLAVAPDARRLGIGKALMLECMHRARRSGAATVGLYSMQRQVAAQGMYRRMGFQRVPELDYWPVPEICVMAFRLDL